MHIRRSLLASARVGLIFPLAALSGAAQDSGRRIV